jgi:hypothetical protein
LEEEIHEYQSACLNQRFQAVQDYVGGKISRECPFL